MFERFGFDYSRLTADKIVEQKKRHSYIGPDTKVVSLSVEKGGEIGVVNGGRGMV